MHWMNIVLNCNYYAREISKDSVMYIITICIITIIYMYNSLHLEEHIMAKDEILQQQIEATVSVY